MCFDWSVLMGKDVLSSWKINRIESTIPDPIISFSSKLIQFSAVFIYIYNSAGLQYGLCFTLLNIVHKMAPHFSKQHNYCLIWKT